MFKEKAKIIRSKAYVTPKKFWEPIVSAYQWHLEEGKKRAKQNKTNTASAAIELNSVIDIILGVLSDCDLPYSLQNSHQSTIIKYTREYMKTPEGKISEQVTHADFLYPSYVILFVLEDGTSPTIIFDMEKAFGFSFKHWKEALLKMYKTEDLQHLQDELHVEHKIWRPLDNLDEFNLLQNIELMAGDIIIFDANVFHAGPGLKEYEHSRCIAFSLLIPSEEECSENNFSYPYEDQFYTPSIFWQVHERNPENTEVWDLIIQQWNNRTKIDLKNLID